MSYDLNVFSSREIDGEIASIAERFACEHHAVPGGHVVSLQVQDDTIAALYQALVELAKSASGRLFDPQLGGDIDLEAPGEVPPLWTPQLPDAPTSHTAVAVRNYTVSIEEAKQTYCERFGATLIRETDDLLEVDLCGVRFSLRVKPRRRRAKSDWVGELPHRVRAEATVITLAPGDYERFAERIRRTGRPPFEFVFAPARREVPGEEPAHCFVITDGNENYIELRRAPGPG